MKSGMWQRIRAARNWAKLSQQVVADACGVSRAAVALWESEDADKRTAPRHENIKAISRLTGAPIGWLFDDEAELNASHLIDRPWPTANQVAESSPENAYLPDGTLIGIEPGGLPTKGRKCPVISWANASFDKSAIDHLEPGDAIEWDWCSEPCSRFTYGLYVRGDSMYPEFFDGDLIWVDPELAPQHNDYVVVRNSDTDDVTLKRFVDEDGRRYLKAMNPDWPEPYRIVSEHDRFCGVVIDQKRGRRRNGRR